MKTIVHIEVVQCFQSNLSKDRLKEAVDIYVKHALLIPGQKLNITDNFIKEHVEFIYVCDLDDGLSKSLLDSTTHLVYHIFRLDPNGGQNEVIESFDNGDEPTASKHWILPSADFTEEWDNLIFEEPIKERLLHFAETSLLFSEAKINPCIISWNRVVLLHGPPGTGKTSLCRALAQKLSIRLCDKYSHGELVEINSHSLFSKWFSESGKLVTKMFDKIQEIVANPRALVFVLIDEVESLTQARKSVVSGVEPSDAIRVVNAVLTQLDKLRRCSNVLILSTSNMTNAIDNAFIDRADILQYIGNPGLPAIFKIYCSCLTELQRVGIITSDETLLPFSLVQFDHGDASKCTRILLDTCRQSIGLSGRVLRKIPFLAFANYIRHEKVTMEEYLIAIQKAVGNQFNDREQAAKC